MITASGCIVRSGGLVDKAVAPIPISVENASKTIALSTRTDLPYGSMRYQDETLLPKKIIQVYEAAGYIVHVVPWTHQPATHARIRILLHEDSHVSWLRFSAMTLCVMPGYGRHSLSVTTTGYVHGIDKTHQVHADVSVFSWLPLIVGAPFSDRLSDVYEANALVMVRHGILAMRQANVLPMPSHPLTTLTPTKVP